MASSTSMTTDQLKSTKQYAFLKHCWVQPSEHSYITVWKETFAVKTFLPSTSRFQELSSDHYTWVRKLIRKPRKTTDATSLLINDVLVSKKTRYPRIIDDNSLIFELCATGEYDEVNRLLSLGKATIVDVNSRGESLLHIAASHWHAEVCQLLISKGADVDACDWRLSQTPLGVACLAVRDARCKLANSGFETEELTNVVRLLLESGLDVQASVEIDCTLFWLAEYRVESRDSRSMIHSVSRAFSWLLQRYIQTATCDGLLLSAGLHPEACAAIRERHVYYPEETGPRGQYRANCEFLTHKDTLICHSFWLHMIGDADTYEVELGEISPHFCQTYTGDFHYQQSWELGGCLKQVSPMELALRSFSALTMFNRILLACGTDIIPFTEIESKMTWCNFTQEMLISFFSLQSLEHERFRSLFPSVRMCPHCLREFQHKGAVEWGDTIELVRSGGSLASLLRFSSEEEEEILNFQMRFCETCRVDMQTPSESDDSEDDQAEDDDEDMGFIESEIEDDENSASDMRVSRVEHGQMEDYADADSSDESSSDEDLGGEQIG